MFSHLYHSLRISDEATIMTIRGICYDMNLLHPDSRISHELGISNEISTTTTDMWKNIYKTALTGEQAGEDNELDNHPNFAHPHIASTRLSEQLIPRISTSLILKL